MRFFFAFRARNLLRYSLAPQNLAPGTDFDKVLLVDDGELHLVDEEEVGVPQGAKRSHKEKYFLSVFLSSKTGRSK